MCDAGEEGWDKSTSQRVGVSCRQTASSASCDSQGYRLAVTASCQKSRTILTPTRPTHGSYVTLPSTLSGDHQSPQGGAPARPSSGTVVNNKRSLADISTSRALPSNYGYTGLGWYDVSFAKHAAGSSTSAKLLANASSRLPAVASRSSRSNIGKQVDRKNTAKMCSSKALQ